MCIRDSVKIDKSIAETIVGTTRFFLVTIKIMMQITNTATLIKRYD